MEADIYNRTYLKDYSYDRNYSIKTILGYQADPSSYQDDEDILYVRKINKDAVVSLIESFQDNASSYTSSIKSSIQSILSLLSNTNSEVYNDSIQKEKLTNFNEKIVAFETDMNSIDISQVKTDIDNYNTALVDLKKLTRLHLLQKKCVAINSENKFVSASIIRSTQWAGDGVPYLDSPTSYEDGKYKIVKRWVYVSDVAGTWDITPKNYNLIASKYIFIDIEGASAETLEARLTELGYPLPYNTIIDMI